MQLQINQLHSEFDSLQTIFGDPDLNSIYGAGDIVKPNLCFVFMYPTAKNISTNPNWQGIRAPWLGTKNIWKLFYRLKIISSETFAKTQSLKSSGWAPVFCLNLYSEIAKSKVYITNLAKCTQLDARPLPNSVFKAYLTLFHREMAIVKPRKIFTFGNQVSSIIVGKNISVSTHIPDNNIFPVHYPVGQGMRNMEKALSAISLHTPGV